MATADAAWIAAELTASLAYDGAITTANANWATAEFAAWNIYQSTTTSPTPGPQIILASFSSGSSKSGGKTTPLPPYNKIGKGFPTKLPPAGQVSIVIAQRDAHTFLILLDSAGNMTYFRGGPEGGGFFTGAGTLKVETGKYGKGAEPYMPKETKFDWRGNTKATDANAKLKALMDRLNKAEHGYGKDANNCNTTSCLGLEALGKKVPNTPVPNPSRSTPGWGDPVN